MRYWMTTVPFQYRMMVSREGESIIFFLSLSPIIFSALYDNKAYAVKALLSDLFMYLSLIAFYFLSVAGKMYSESSQRRLSW